MKHGSEILESGELLRAITDNLPNSYLSIIDKHHVVVFSSGQEFKKQNLDPESFKGLALDKVFGDKTEIVRKHYAETFLGNEQSFELFMNNQYQLYKTVPLFSESGEIDRILVVVEDISAWKQSENELRESEEKLKNILENSTNLFYSHTPDHMLTYLSPQVKQILGYTVEEALVKWTEFVSDHPVNEAGFKNTMKAIETGERQPPYELELVRKDGEKIWAEVREFPHVVNGKTVAVSGSLTEITERKKALEDLKNSEEKFRLIAENTADNIAITTFDSAARYLYVSPSLQKIVGLKEEDLLGRSFFEFVHPEDKNVIFPLLKSYLSRKLKNFFSADTSEISEMIEYRFKNKAGEWRNFQSTVTIMENNLLSVTRDITKQKKDQEEIIRLKDGLEEEVKKKTAELKEKVDDLQRFFDAAVDRELRMEEIYGELESLKKELAAERARGKNS